MFDSLVILEILDNYEIYQNLLKLIHEKHNDYKRELNRWLDYIFDTHNSYYQITAKNFRKKWFIPLLCSLSYTTECKRRNRSYRTNFNNVFIEGMNNKIKLIKRKAHGFRYFYNLRKHIFLHLGYSYTFTCKGRKKGIPIFQQLFLHPPLMARSQFPCNFKYKIFRITPHYHFFFAFKPNLFARIQASLKPSFFSKQLIILFIVSGVQ